LKEGTLGDLILPESGLRDRRWVSLLGEERKVPLLGRATNVFASLRTHLKGKPPLIQLLSSQVHNRVPATFAPSMLNDTLFRFLHATKPPSLSDVECSLPTVYLSAKSPKHAYTLLSEYYEPQRVSHTGNVFKKILYSDRRTGLWWPLDRLRADREAL